MIKNYFSAKYDCMRYMLPGELRWVLVWTGPGQGNNVQCIYHDNIMNKHYNTYYIFINVK